MDFEFLKEGELESRLFEDYIDESTQEDVEAALAIEQQAISFIKNKLRHRYDVEIIFSDAPYDDRPLIIWAMAGIVSYRLIRRNAARKVPSDFAAEYEEVMNWLKDVRDGKESPVFPTLESAQKQVLWGNSKNENLYL